MNIANQITSLGLISNDDRIELGKVSGSVFKKEELTEGQLNHHVHIVGASGFGKTKSVDDHHCNCKTHETEKTSSRIKCEAHTCPI